MKEIVIAGVADSPKITTGFAQVSNQIYNGFHKAGFKLYAFGILDWQPDITKKLPYPFWPTTPIDLLGKEEVTRFVSQVEPDIVWIMIDPGNLLTYAINLIELNNQRKEKGLKTFKILAYPPVEGKPLSVFQATAFKHIMENGGDVILWCNSAANEAEKWLPEHKFDSIPFGTDHAEFFPMTGDERKMLREKVGLDDFFMVGSVGVNKRTKGFPTLIYAAVHLKYWGYEDKIKFYGHTDPLNPTMQGHHLIDMADRYGVRNMFLWKPDNNQQKNGNYYIGNNRSDGTLFRVKEIKKPRTSEGRKQLWESYDYISKMNCMNTYCDTSQVEGWGLPQCFHPDTNIYTILGQKPISEVNVGDLVLTHTGQWQQVKNRMSRLATAKLVKARYNHSMIVTSEHPVLAIKRGKSKFITLKKFNKELNWIPVSDLEVGDILVTPKPKLPEFHLQNLDLRLYSKNIIVHPENKDLIASKYSNSGTNKSSVSLKLIAEEVGVDTEVVSRVARGKGSVGQETRVKIEEKFKKYNFDLEKKWMPAIIALDEEIAELMGWYVAEGSYNSNTVEFSMSADEMEDGLRLVEIITKRFNIKPYTMFKDGKMRICISSSIFGSLLEKECGKGASNKFVSDRIIFSNENIIKSFLKGYTRGDGSVLGSGKIAVSITTTSKKLVYQIKELLLRVGILTTLSENRDDCTVIAGGKAAIKWAEISEEDDLIDKSKRQGQGYYEDNNYFYYPITEIIDNYYSGPVFNIEVADDNSYVANYVTVHNCEAMSCGVPLISVHDSHVRDEIYGDVACMMNPLSPDLWETWHTSARLVSIDPLEVARSIERMYQSQELRQLVASRGLERVSQMRWIDTQRAMNQKVVELFNR